MCGKIPFTNHAFLVRVMDLLQGKSSANYGLPSTHGIPEKNADLKAYSPDFDPVSVFLSWQDNHYHLGVHPIRILKQQPFLKYPSWINDQWHGWMIYRLYTFTAKGKAILSEHNRSQPSHHAMPCIGVLFV